MHEIDLHFGNDVLLSDGKAGKLCGVAVNTENNQITHLLVEDGFLLKKTRAFPFPIAAPAGADIALAVAAGAVEDYPIYREETIAVPAEGGGTAWTGSGQQVATAPPTTYQKVRYGVPDGRAVLKRGATITAADGRAGKLEGVLAAAQGGAVTGLVVQHGAIILSRHLVPAELVETISQSGIFLHVSGEEVANLPPYP